MRDYDALKNKIAYLKAKCDTVEYQIAEYYRLAGLSWLESQRNPLLDDVSPMYMSAVMALVNQMVDIKHEVETKEKELPCEEFIRRFGLGLHEAYREKHPIDRNTALCNVNTFFPVWRYAIPPSDFGPVFDLDLTPSVPRVPFNQGEARFERWGWGKGQLEMQNLAYAPEINTVFVNQK